MQKSKFIHWVNKEAAKELHKESFFSLPLKMRIGIFMLIASFIIGYGGPVVILIFSGIHKKIASGILNGSILYLFSWVLGAAGLALAGKDCIKYPIYFFAYFFKMLFPKFVAEKTDVEKD